MQLERNNNNRSELEEELRKFVLMDPLIHQIKINLKMR